MSGTVRTALLMSILTGLLLAIGWIVGYLTGLSISSTLTFAFMLAIALNLFMYFYADKWVLSMYRAKVVSEEEHPVLHKIVERLAKNAGIPKPKIAIVPSDVPNAFATGRSPSHSVVAVTRGALDLLSEEELEGVLAHEVAHVKNRDMLINTIAAIIGAAITYVFYFAFLAGGRREQKGSPLFLLLLPIIPFAAMLVRLAISRGREYEADAAGASISKKPLALARALRKIQESVIRRPLDHGNPSTTHLFIVNPFRGVSLASLFSTHPPTEERIKRLEWMAKTGNY
ncbi:MAG: M48 family metalloprotease [Candidatus Hadarchaeales archaeon]